MHLIQVRGYGPPDARNNRRRLALDVWRAQRGGPDGIARRRQQRLAELVAYVRARSPFYQQLYATLPEGPIALEHLPPSASHN